MENELTLLRRRVERERQARLQAELLLERKSLELYQANEELRQLNASLEERILERAAELQRKDRQYRSLIQNLHAGILLEDQNRHIVLTNQLFCELFGIPVPPDALIGADCSQSVEQTKHLFKEPEEFAVRISELLTNRTLCVGEELEMADGRMLERDYIPIFDNDQYLGHLWRYEDITEQRRVQELIRQSEEKYRGIIENMDLGLMEVDNNDVIQRVYPRFIQLTGYQPEELVGRRAMDVLLPDPAFHNLISDQNRERQEGKPGVYEVPIQRKDGEIKWVIVSGAPIVNSDGEVVGSVGIHLDITERKKTQQALEEAQRIAEEARQAEKRFLANMSHEIRTPINAIIGMTHLLLDTQLTHAQRDYLNAISSSSDLLLSLVSDVLDFSKIEAGEMKLTETDFILPELVEDMMQTFRFRANSRPVRLECLLDSQLPRRVVGDPTFLQRILMNLIGNSLKFTEKGRIRLEAFLQEKTDDSFTIAFSVSDTGIGIEADALPTIFNSFRQAGSVKMRFGGTGLGLAIVRQLVHLHGGDITVESEVGRGTTFHFTLKMGIAKQSPRLSAPAAARLSMDRLRLNNILIVEDNLMNQKYIGGLLTKWQLPFTMASSGEEAIRLAGEMPFDLILMDLMMPGMDGYQTVAGIRKMDNPNSQLPIVALTATAFADERARALKEGMNDYLSKPFTPDQLRTIIERYLSEKSNEVTEDEDTPGTPFRFNPALDTDSLTQLFGSDLAYAQMMFELFQQTIVPELGQLVLLAQADERNAVTGLLHKVRPSLGMVGLTELAAVFKATEHQLRQEASHQELVKQVAHLEELMNDWLPIVERETQRLARAVSMLD